MTQPRRPSNVSAPFPDEDIEIPAEAELVSVVRANENYFIIAHNLNAMVLLYLTCIFF